MYSAEIFKRSILDGLNSSIVSGTRLEDAESFISVNAVTCVAAMTLPAEKIVGELSSHHHITVDGYVLPQTPYEAYAAGIHNEEAQLHGFNREDVVAYIEKLTREHETELTVLEAQLGENISVSDKKKYELSV